MGFYAWITLGITAVLLVGLARDLAPDVLFLATAVLLAAIGVITPNEAFAGFANEGMLTVAALFIVAAGLRETGVMDYVGDHLLGRVATERGALLRLTAILIPHGIFLNNTPVVALLLP